MKKTYAVFGLGRYGIAVAKELVDNGAEVLAVDENEENVQNAASVLPVCKCADVSDPQVIKQLDIASFDVVIICMATNLEASVMAISLCKEVGVKTVIAKCANSRHEAILAKVGADKVVFPEKESGIRLAKNLLSAGFTNSILISEGISIINIEVPVKWAGKTLMELNLRKHYSINVIGIQAGEDISIDVNPNEPLTAGQNLVVIAHAHKIKKLMKDIA